MSAEAIAKALRGRKMGKGWAACCPAHNDRDPSLSIRDGANGKVLFYCHAGCDQKQVLEALRFRGLWDERRTGNFVRSRGRYAAHAAHDAQPSEYALSC
jgi:putative DNA primase/helicase